MKEPQKILIVDDREENLVALETVLRETGARIFRARSGEEALRSALDHDFAMVFLDVRMPGMDGYEVAGHLSGQEQTRTLPIIMVTAEYDQDEAVLKGYAAGAVDYLVKPYRPSVLLAKAAIFLDLDRQKRELRRHRDHLEAVVEERTQELRQSIEDLHRSNRDLEDFAYVASHDLQEPLRNVSSYVQLLARRYEDALDEDARDFIRFAVEGTERMRRLINDLLALSRVGTSGRPFETVDTREVLNQLLEDMQPALDESGAQVACGDLPVVRADASQIRQLFQNLLGNATKFRGEEPPRIRITAVPAAEPKTPAPDEGPASGREGCETGWWRFRIEDNGIGIDPRHAERIFQPFQRLHGRREYPGTGIGLALCRRILDRHGGDIHVESEEGRGATFTWTLPAA